MEFNELCTLLDIGPYDLSINEKEPLFINALKEVTFHHYNNCNPYRKLCDKRGFDPIKLVNIEDLIYLPTTIFKDALLLSISEDDVFREINSSATTSGRPSRMGLDKQTSKRQSKCFNKLVLNRLGNKRRQFVILDTSESISRSDIVSARSSTIRSLLFCANKTYTCIDENDGKLTLNIDKLDNLLKKAEADGEEIVIFGFTYILYSFVVKELIKMKKFYNLPGSKVIHIGGWKKLEEKRVSSEMLINECCRAFGVKNRDVIDFYGFTEQSGMIYPTCEAGLRHVPVWSDIIVRDTITLDAMPPGETGLMQFITPIQTSYPGHSVLTEDMGYIEDVEECPCGRKGKVFKVIGRFSAATEIRGCGDIMADNFA